MSSKKNLFLKPSAVIFAVIIAMVSSMALMFVKTNAIAENNDNRSFTYTPNQDSADPYYGTKAYWDEKFGQHEDKYLEDVEAGTVLAAGTYFIKDTVEIKFKKSGVPGLIISGKVNLFFEDGGSLIINVIDSPNGEGSAPGIRLSEGNSLNIEGKGFLKIKGSNVNVDSSYIGAKNDQRSPGLDSYYSDKYNHGYNGSGGSGSGGVSAVIGTDGGNGGLGGNRVKEQHVEWWDTWSDVGGWHANPAGEAGNNGEGSYNSGKLMIGGLVSLDFDAGKLNTSGTPNVGNYTDTWKTKWGEYWFWSQMTFLGANGGGGQGGLGFTGAIIGSGGSGAGGGGAGGLGGADYAEKGWDLLANGGGGGAGGGSVKTFGGKGRPGKDDSDYDHEAKDGEDFDPEKSKSTFGKGGRGAGGGSPADGSGSYGGDGGGLVESGSAGDCYVVPGTFSNYGNAIDQSKYNGKESKKYLVWPQDDCKVVFHDSVADDEPTFYFDDDREIKPKFDVIYVPTGEIISPAYYEYEYEHNTSPGDAFLRIHNNNELSTETPVIGKSMTESGASFSAKFKISNYFELNNFSFGNKVYDGIEIEPNTEKTTIVDSQGKKIPSLNISMLKYKYYKFDEASDEYVSIDTVPVDSGEYYAQVYIKNQDYYDEPWTCPNTYKFTISKIDINIVSHDLKIFKIYDRTAKIKDDTETSGSFDVNNILDSEQDKIIYEPIIQDFDSSDVHESTINNTIEFKNRTDEDVLKNYNYLDKTASYKYIISPRFISWVSAVPTNRVYKKDDFSVEFKSVIFDNIPEGIEFAEGEDWEKIGYITDGSCVTGRHSCMCIFTLINTNFAFNTENPTEYILNSTVQIVGNSVDKPKPSTNKFIYNGKDQTYDVPPVEGVYNVEGNIRKDAGKYDVKYTLCDNYLWSDGSADPVVLTWVIKKHEGLTFKQLSLDVAYTDCDYERSCYVPITDMPTGFNITSRTVKTTKQTAYFDYVTVDDDNILTYKVHGHKRMYEREKIIFTYTSDNYEDSKLEVVPYQTINGGESYSVTVNGFNIESKTYDGNPVEVGGSPVVKVKKSADDHICYENNVANECEGSINHEFYKVEGGQEIKLESAPEDVGIYKFRSIVDTNLFKGNSEYQTFEIKKNKAIDFDKCTIDRCIGVKNMNENGDLNISKKISKGQEYEVSYYSKDDKDMLIKEGSISVDHDGVYSFIFEEKYMKVDRQAKICFVVKMENYEDSYIYVDIKIVPKGQVEISGLEVFSKTYDKEILQYNDENLKIMAAGVDLTESLENWISVRYTNVETREVYEPNYSPVDAGTYEIELYIDQANEYYEGRTSIEAKIFKIELQFKEDEKYRTIEKQYDGTTNLPDGFKKTQDITLTNVLGEEDVKAKVIFDDYSQADVYEETKAFMLNLYGDDIKNYGVKENCVFASYLLEPRAITVDLDKSQPIDRAYNPEDHEIDMDVKFNNIIDQHEPIYTAKATIENNDAGKNIPINKFQLALLGKTPNNNALLSASEDEEPTSNYAIYNDEGKPEFDLDVTCKEGNPWYVDIEKADVDPSQFILTDNVTYENECGDKVYEWEHNKFPEGFFGDGTTFDISELIDQNKILSNVEVEGSTIKFTLNEFESIDATAVIKTNVKSNNYNDVTATLNIALKDIPTPPQPTPDPPTPDPTPQPTPVNYETINSTNEGAQTGDDSFKLILIFGLIAVSSSIIIARKSYKKIF